ncbi:MAG: aminoacyl-tRNA hydrolase, partial [Candidatus Hydrogenedentes bacterium]|nr:aminoacyl-tRNA hydrolase [Candidatus Hydrogenedentota bacterium]
MKLIVGLGNPGTRYRYTRHNVGFEVVDKLAGQLQVSLTQEKHGGLYCETRHAGAKLLLLKPLTFMNRSGSAVALAMRNSTMEPGDVLVIADDVNLPLGQVRLRAKGSAGGHNGLKSVIACLGTQEFPRLRIGVGEEEHG